MKTIVERDTSKTWSGLEAPIGWYIADTIHSHEEPHPICGYFWERLSGQRIAVMEDVSIKADGKRWLHVSVSKPNRKMPTYEDIQEVRRLFVGEHRECYQVFPTSDRYVDFYHVLHLWCNLDEPDGVLPHFEASIILNGKEMLSV